MDNIKCKLQEIKELLEKVAIPSPKGPKLPSLPKIGITKPIQPTLAPGSKKDPTKVAEQTQDPNAKAQAINMAKEKIKLAKNGQWSLE